MSLQTEDKKYFLFLNCEVFQNDLIQARFLIIYQGGNLFLFPQSSFKIKDEDKLRWRNDSFFIYDFHHNQVGELFSALNSFLSSFFSKEFPYGKTEVNEYYCSNGFIDLALHSSIQNQGLRIGGVEPETLDFLERVLQKHHLNLEESAVPQVRLLTLEEKPIEDLAVSFVSDLESSNREESNQSSVEYSSWLNLYFASSAGKTFSTKYVAYFDGENFWLLTLYAFPLGPINPFPRSVMDEEELSLKSIWNFQWKVINCQKTLTPSWFNQGMSFWNRSRRGVRQACREVLFREVSELKRLIPQQGSILEDAFLLTDLEYKSRSEQAKSDFLEMMFYFPRLRSLTDYDQVPKVYDIVSIYCSHLESQFVEEKGYFRDRAYELDPSGKQFYIIYAVYFSGSFFEGFWFQGTQQLLGRMRIDEVLKGQSRFEIGQQCSEILFKMVPNFAPYRSKYSYRHFPDILSFDSLATERSKTIDQLWLNWPS